MSMFRDGTIYYTDYTQTTVNYAREGKKSDLVYFRFLITG